MAWKSKVESLLTMLDIPIMIFAACGKNSRFRKPRLGMWAELISMRKEARSLQVAEEKSKDCLLSGASSFFVGDAAGRQGNVMDHSSSDR